MEMIKTNSAIIGIEIIGLNDNAETPTNLLRQSITNGWTK